MNSNVIKKFDKMTRKRTRPIASSIIAIMLISLAILLYTYLKPIELRTYELPARLYPAQELFRYPSEDSIYIPSVNEVTVSRLSDYLILKSKYGGLLQEFEQQIQQEDNNELKEGPHGMVVYDKEYKESQLYVAQPAYIAGSNEADRPVQYGYEFEIMSVPSGKNDQLIGSTIVTIDGHPPTVEKVNEILASKARHQIKTRSDDGKILFHDTSFYGAYFFAHYTINEFWKFGDLMRFDLANVKGDSGGAATAYEVMLKKKGISNTHGEFVITGAIDVEGNITSVGGVKAKTYLAIKHSVPVMFVPQGMNYSDSIEMKSLMKSSIDIVPIQKLGDIEAYWNKEA